MGISCSFFLPFAGFPLFAPCPSLSFPNAKQFANLFTRKRDLHTADRPVGTFITFLTVPASFCFTSFAISYSKTARLPERRERGTTRTRKKRGEKTEHTDMNTCAAHIPSTTAFFFKISGQRDNLLPASPTFLLPILSHFFCCSAYFCKPLSPLIFSSLLAGHTVHLNAHLFSPDQCAEQGEKNEKSE